MARPIAVNMTTTQGSRPTTTSTTTNSSSGGAVPSLLEMADYFLRHNPQHVQEAVKCLLAVLSLSPPPRVEVRAKLQLGLVLYHHSNNLLEARQFLEEAMLSSQSVTGVEESRFEAASVLARIHVEQGSTHHAKKVIKSVMDVSYRYPYWHCRLLLQKANIHVCERDRDSLFATLSQTADFADHNHAPYTRLLCLLCKGAHLLIYKLYQDAALVLSKCCQLMDDYTGPHATQLKALYLIIQVAHLLVAGQIKTAKPHLKQLQQCVKNLCSEPDPPTSQGSRSLGPESFEWLSKEQTYILVYLVSLMHAVLAGRTDKATSYANKALGLLQQQQQENQFKETGNSVLGVFQAHILELTIVCRLMQGNCSQAAESLQEAVEVCHCHSQLIYSHRAVLHTLLGLYSFATDNLDEAIAQFQTALQHTNSSELRAFVTLNLAMAYLKQGPHRDRELATLIETLQSESSAPSSQSLKGALSFVKGLYMYKQFRVHEAKKHLRETLMVSNSNDLIKLTVCALVVLGQIFLSLGNTKETQDMANPAFQLAGKIPDKRLQAWSAALLADLHHSTGNGSQEHAALQALSQTMEDIATDARKAVSSAQHSLIQWTVGDWPIPKKNKKPQVGKDMESALNSASPEPVVDLITEPRKEETRSSTIVGGDDDDEGDDSQSLMVKIPGTSLSKKMLSGKKRNIPSNVGWQDEVEQQSPKHPRMAMCPQPGMVTRLDFDHSTLASLDYGPVIQSESPDIISHSSHPPVYMEQKDLKKEEFLQHPPSTDIPFAPSPPQIQTSQPMSAVSSSQGKMWQSLSNPSGGWTEVVPPEQTKRRESMSDHHQKPERNSTPRDSSGFPLLTPEIRLSQNQLPGNLLSSGSGARSELLQQQQQHGEWQVHQQQLLEQQKMQQQVLEQQRIKQEHEQRQQLQHEQQQQPPKLERQQHKRQLEQQLPHHQQLEQQHLHQGEIGQQPHQQLELAWQHHQREMEQQQRYQRELEKRQYHQNELEHQQHIRRELEQVHHQREQDRSSHQSSLLLGSPPPLGIRPAERQAMPGSLLHHAPPVFTSLSRHSQLQRPPSVHSPATSSPQIFSPPQKCAAPSPSTPPRVFSPPQQHPDRQSPALHTARHSPHPAGMADCSKVAAHSHRQPVQTSPLSHSGSSQSSGHVSPGLGAANPISAHPSAMRQSVAMHQMPQYSLIAERQQEPGSQKLPAMPQLTPFSQYAQPSLHVPQHHYTTTVQPHAASAHQQQLMSLLQQQHQNASATPATLSLGAPSSIPTTYQQSRMVSMSQHKFVQQPSQQASSQLQQQQQMMSLIHHQQAKPSPLQQGHSLLHQHHQQQQPSPQAVQGVYWHSAPQSAAIHQKQFSYSALSPEAVLHQQQKQQQQQQHMYMQQHGTSLLSHMTTSQFPSMAGHSPGGVLIPSSVVHLSQQGAPLAGVFSMGGAGPGHHPHHIPAAHTGLYHHLSQQQSASGHIPGSAASLVQPSLVHHTHPLMAAHNAQAIHQQLFQHKPN